MKPANDSHERRAAEGADKITIFLVDDHPVVLLGVAELLERESDFEVVGAADNCRDACKQIGERRPDIVLSDLEMGDDMGRDTVMKLNQCSCARIVVFTAHRDDEHILDAIQLGVRGYVMKGSTAEQLCDAIRIVARGGTYLDPEVASRVTARLSQRGKREQADPDRLTSREFAVLQCIAAGKANREIARELFISERTVKFHCSSVLAKLGAKNRTEAVRIAAKRRLVSF